MIHASARLEEARDLLVKRGVGALGVTGDDGSLSGVLSLSDLLRVGKTAALSRSGRRATAIEVPDDIVENVATRSPVVVERDAPVHEAARLMIRHRIHRVFVMKDGVPEGVISTRDLLRVIVEKRMDSPLAELGQKGVVSVKPDDEVSVAVDRMQASHVQGLVVVEGDWPIGIFSQSEALAARGWPAGSKVAEVMSPAVVVLPEELSLHRAAAQALSLQARRVVLSDGSKVSGIVSGLDFARALL